MSHTTASAAAALLALNECAAKRIEDINAFQSVPNHDDSDAENDSTCPIFDSFLHVNGSDSILQMTNMTSIEFNSLWGDLRECIEARWSTGRGRRCSYSAKDVLFMLLSVLKHAGQWDLLARVFGLKAPTFERIVIVMLRTVSALAYERYVAQMLHKYNMAYLIEKQQTFAHFPFARYATDATFHHTNRPTGNMQESKQYYSGKHKLYGYKSEASVLPNGIAVMISSHYKGATSDLDMFRRHACQHRGMLRKHGEEHGIIDSGKLSDKYPNLWTVLLDKGYYGAAQETRAIYPTKKPVNRMLAIELVAENQEICSDRIVVENYFGRMCSLWAVMSTKYKWKEEYYDHFLKFCSALTNIHIQNHPLRANDSSFYQKFKNKLYHIGVETVRKRRISQQSYRERRRIRIEEQFQSEPAAHREEDEEVGYV